MFISRYTGKLGCASLSRVAPPAYFPRTTSHLSALLYRKPHFSIPDFKFPFGFPPPLLSLTHRVIASNITGNNHQNIVIDFFSSGRTLQITGHFGSNFAFSRARLGQ